MGTRIAISFCSKPVDDWSCCNVDLQMHSAHTDRKHPDRRSTGCLGDENGVRHHISPYDRKNLLMSTILTKREPQVPARCDTVRKRIVSELADLIASPVPAFGTAASTFCSNDHFSETDIEHA